MGNLTSTQDDARSLDTLGFDFLDKLDIHEAKRRQILPRRFKSPLSLLWDLTYHCSLRCVHCYNDSGPVRGHQYQEPELDVLMRVVDYVKAAVIPSACLCGGDVLLNRNFWTVTHELHKIRTCTLGSVFNGWLVNRAVAERIAQYMHTIEVSIDGCTASTHDTIRGRPGSFERAVAAVKLFSEAGMKVIVAFSAMHQNVHEFQQLVEVVVPLGARSVVATHRLLPLGRAASNPTLNLTDCDSELLVAQVERARQLHPNISVHVADNAATWLNDVRNKLPNYRMMIAPDGTIKLMPFVPFTFGNIATDDLDTVWRDSLSSIIENETFQSYMARMLVTGNLKDQSVLPYRDQDIAFASLRQAIA